MQDRILAAGLQPTTSAQFVGLLAARRVCTDTSGDERMRKTSTWLLEQGTQTPSPAPDLIPAETRTENSHWDWYSQRGHFTCLASSPTLAAEKRTYHVLSQPDISCANDTTHNW